MREACRSGTPPEAMFKFSQEGNILKFFSGKVQDEISVSHIEGDRHISTEIQFQY